MKKIAQKYDGLYKIVNIQNNEETAKANQSIDEGKKEYFLFKNPYGGHEYIFDGKRHRVDGPAQGPRNKRWFINDELISEFDDLDKEQAIELLKKDNDLFDDVSYKFPELIIGLSDKELIEKIFGNSEDWLNKNFSLSQIMTMLQSNNKELKEKTLVYLDAHPDLLEKAVEKNKTLFANKNTNKIIILAKKFESKYKL